MIIYIFVLAWTFLPDGLGQCSSKLVEKAVSESGTDAVYVREFKVKLKAGSPKRPVPVGKFTVLLKEKTLYRLNVVNAREYEGMAVMQLFGKGNLLGSTYNMDKKTNEKSFEYFCWETGNYQVAMSFLQGKEGCAVGILSLVVNDSIENMHPIAKEKNMEKLYIGLDNPLNIVTDNEAFDSLKVQISNGEIVYKNKEYHARVFEPGTVTIDVAVLDKNGKTVEEASVDFAAALVPEPVATVQGNRGGLISARELVHAKKLELLTPINFETFGYSIIGFTVHEKNNPMDSYRSSGNSLSPSQIRFIENLGKNAKLVIDNISIKAPNGETIYAQPVVFVIQ
jgi:hypothetical protein